MTPAFSNSNHITKSIALLIALLFGLLAASQVVVGAQIETEQPIVVEDSVLTTVVGEFLPCRANQPTPARLTVHRNRVTPEPAALANVATPVEPIQSADQAGPIVSTKKVLGSQNVQLSNRDEIWFVSARQSHLTGPNLQGLCVTKAVGSEWVDSSLAELAATHETDKSRVTVLYVHGNRTDLHWAEARGLQFYQNAFQTSCYDRPPIRFVMFAWKSEAERKRIYSDFCVKSERSVLVGHTFGKFLGIFNDRNMVLAGFSLGAQVVATGLCDQEQACRDLSSQFRVALFAPAIDSSFVCLGLQRFSANPAISQTKIFLNQRDRAVKAANVIAAKGSHCVTTLRELAQQNSMTPNQIKIVDITTQVTKKHSIVTYALADKLRCELAEMVNTVFATVNPSSAMSAPSTMSLSQSEFGSYPVLPSSR
ncbi:MAG: alpha/beta hydrolase [Mariniblastus sp.]